MPSDCTRIPHFDWEIVAEAKQSVWLTVQVMCSCDTVFARGLSVGLIDCVEDVTLVRDVS